MQSCMRSQAPCSCMPNDGTNGEERGLTPSDAVQRAANLVRELREHCDDYRRLMQQHGGEAQAQTQRVRRHLGRMESSPVRDVRHTTLRGSSRPSPSIQGEVSLNMGHEVHREGGTGGGSGEGEGSASMQRTAPWKKRSSDRATSARLTTSVRRLTPPTASSGSAPSSSTREEPVDNVGGNETHDEAYHRLRICMGVCQSLGA